MKNGGIIGVYNELTLKTQKGIFSLDDTVHGRPFLDGSTSDVAAPSATYIKELTKTTTNGKYWLKPNGGSGIPFQAYCIMDRDGGGWVKALQYYNSTDLSSSSSVNNNGSWQDSEINLFSGGKINTLDWAALNTTNSFLMRCTGGTDNLFNSGAGTAKLQYSTTLAPFGTDIDPTSSYTLYLDMTSNNSYDYGVTYTNDTRTRCNHTTNFWISDHNYNGSLPAGFSNPPVGAYYAICWTFGINMAVTNLHWMSGLSTQSAGSVGWGNNTASSFSIFIK